jgi:triosephosphate isomerase
MNQPTTTKKKLVIGNWKMHGSFEANEQLIEAIVQKKTKHQMVICVPYVYLGQVSILTEEHIDHIDIGAQDVSAHGIGAYTGEVSAQMLKEFDCGFVIIGHSERRQYHHESDELLRQKVNQTLNYEMTPIYCVGENKEQRENNTWKEVITQQLQVLKNTSELGIIIAYEPVWAIGTGLTATPQQAQEVHEFIRSQLNDLGLNAQETAILYGGSVKADNASALFAMNDVDGALVGGASLNAKDFVTIANAKI